MLQFRMWQNLCAQPSQALGILSMNGSQINEKVPSKQHQHLQCTTGHFMHTYVE